MCKLVFEVFRDLHVSCFLRTLTKLCEHESSMHYSHVVNKEICVPHSGKTGFVTLFRVLTALARDFKFVQS